MAPGRAAGQHRADVNDALDPHLTVLHAAGPDDDATVERTLQALGHRVVVAADGGAALAVLEQQAPQLLVVDHGFDGGRGEAFVAGLRASPRGTWVPVLLTGAAGEPLHDLRRALEAGADDWLPQPLDPQWLALRLHALQRIAAAYSGLHAVLDHVQEGVILIDGRGTVRAFNRAAENMFGHTAPEIVGRNVSLLMPPPDREAHDGYIARFRHSREPRVIGRGREVTALRRNGERFPAQLSVSAVSGARRDSFIGLVRDLSGERERERLAHIALHDALTGLPNRAQFGAALEAQITQARERDDGFALLFVDVDRFKQINDRHGHAIGDAVLGTLAGRLKHGVSRGDLVARLAGDEFIVLLRGVRREAVAHAVAQRLHEAVGTSLVFETCRIELRVSIGIALYGRDGRDAGSLMAAADAAMYRAKRRAARTGES